MKTQNYDGAEARRVLAAIITDNAVCGRVSAVWRPEGLFALPWANLAAGLAVRYYREYNRAPNGQYQCLFEEWAAHTTTDEKTMQAIEKFLQTVSDAGAAEQASTKYLEDLAGKHFNAVALQRVMDDAKAELDNGKVDEARAKLRNHVGVNIGEGSYIEPLSDIELWFPKEESTQRAMVRYREDLGAFIGDDMVRGTLFSFMSPDKVGKTTWLVDAVYRALRNRCRVAFFEMGDGTMERFMRRLGIRATGKPLRAGVYRIPDHWGADDKLEHYERQLAAYEPVDGYAHVRRIGRSDDALRVDCYANGSASVVDLDNLLGDWEREDWRPDVVVIDYADIMAPPPGFKDTLEQIDETWKSLKRLSQERDCLVLTATQSSAAAYDMAKGGLLGKRHFSGRKTKIAHVDGMLGINVSSTEKSQGAARINWIARRDGESDELDFCRVAGNMALGNPAMISKRRG